MSVTGGSGELNLDPRAELVQRLATSSTFEKAHRLREFFLHISRCAIENRPEEATEQQIGIRVFGRSPGYNANGDNIVRSQARLLRLKLEHHFANEGKDEPLVISIPKGQYVPVFENRPAVVPERSIPVTPPPPEALPQNSHRASMWLYVFVALSVVLGGATISLASILIRSHGSASTIPVEHKDGASSTADSASSPALAAVVPLSDEVRIAAGLTRGSYVDPWGRRWESDRYFSGGAAEPGVTDLVPPPPDPGIGKTMRESLSADSNASPSQRAFSYDIPVRPGVYELRLYFADPIRHNSGLDNRQGGENLRRFNVMLNGRPLLLDFDALSDAGFASLDVRAFKDVVPDADGKVHLQFEATYQRSFVTAVELTPGTQGKMKTIRLSTRHSSFTDTDGTRWSGDNYFINGRAHTTDTAGGVHQFPPLYSDERYGNFSYAIPVPPGSYTVKLHFAETFFTPLIPAMLCHGVGCRVFDVNCNGTALLRDFDISQEAGGAFRPVVRTFTGLHPNGQGKLLLSFTPTVNYAEVRAIEVIDEAK